MGRAVYAYNTVSNAARIGSRVATVNQILTSSGECDQSKPITDALSPHWSIQACAANGATGLGLDESAVTVSYGPPPTQPTLSCPANPTSVDPLHVGCLVDVTVRYTWSPITPIVSRIWSGISMSYTLRVLDRESIPVSRAPRDRHPPRADDGAEGRSSSSSSPDSSRLLGFTALVIDGGNVWAQQRMTQNGSGCGVRGRGRHPGSKGSRGQPTPAGGWDAAVLAQVQTIATANRINLGGAFYTDICGIPLQADGTAALDVERELRPERRRRSRQRIPHVEPRPAPTARTRSSGRRPVCSSSRIAA